MASLVPNLTNLPIADSLKDYTPENFRKDAMAGLTVALLAIPQCMAYALIANVDPVYGLYAGIVGTIVGSILGSSRMMITGPTATLCLVIGGVVSATSSSPDEAIMVVLVLSVMTGILQLLFSVLRIGNLARFVSNAVMSGFIMGGAVVIIGDQFISLLRASGETSPFFVERLFHAVSKLFGAGYQFPAVSFLVGIGTVVLMFVLEQIHNRIPSGLIAVVLGGLLVYLVPFGPDTLPTVNEIQQVIPSLVWPDIGRSALAELFPGALAITLLATVQSVSISKSIATQTLDSIDENQELVGQGLANIGCGLVSTFPVCGSLSRSFFNHSAGAKTHLSGVLCGLFMVLLILFAGSLIPYVPMGVLHGLVIYVMFGVFDWEDIKISLFTTRRDMIVFIGTFLAVLVLKLDWAVYAGVAVSLIVYIRQATRLDLKEYIIDQSGQLEQITDFEDRIEPEIAFIDVNGETFFGSADQIKERIQKIIQESSRIKVIILRMKNALNLDITGAMVLKEIALMLKEQERTLMICGATPQIRDVLKEAEVADVIGEDKILVAQKSLLASSRQAIDRAKAHIDAVLEGEETREGEEDPPLKHTMERIVEKKNEEGTDLDETGEDPVREEKVQPPPESDVDEESGEEID